MSTNKIQHKRSSTENNPPSSLDAGEIAINTNATTPHIHFEDAGGDMRSVGADPTATGDYVRRVTASGTANTWVATNSVPGTGDGSGDFGFWNRDDTTNTLEPRQANDNLDIGSGGLSADNGTFTGRIRVGTDLIFDKLGTADVTISAATPGDARTYTFPAQAGDRNITLDPAAPASTTQYVRKSLIPALAPGSLQRIALPTLNTPLTMMTLTSQVSAQTEQLTQSTPHL